MTKRRRNHGSSPELRQLVRRLRKLGIAVEHTGGQHLRVLAPGGTVVLPSTTSLNGRKLKNAVAELRRHGVPL